MSDLDKVFVGRQMILNDKEEVYAYELLFRDADNPQYNNIMKTAAVIRNTVGNIGTDKVLGNKKGFINVNEIILMEDFHESFDPDQIVLELLETTAITPEVVKRVEELKNKGYVFALDDFIFNAENFKKFQPVFPLISVLKVDLLENTNTPMLKGLEYLKKYNMKFLAEKVENRDAFDACQKMGFDYYQGFFFAKPEIIDGKKVDASVLGITKLITMIRGRAPMADIEKEFKSYPGLMFNFLKYTNSVGHGFQTKITSIKHAINLLGPKRLLKWLTLLMYISPSGEVRSEPAMVLALQRGQFMEAMAAEINQIEDADMGFFVGVLSLLDVVYNVPLTKILAEMNLDEAISRALLQRTGPLGELFQLTQLVEGQKFSEAYTMMEKLQVDPNLLAPYTLKSYASNI